MRVRSDWQIGLKPWTTIEESKISTPSDLHIGDGLLQVATTSLEDDKAEDLVTIDLAGKSALGDYMIIATGRSQRQVTAMAEHLLEKLKGAGAKGVTAEGRQRGDWVLIDAGDIIVHLFRPEVRQFYDLEKMWGVDLAPANMVRVGGESGLAHA